MSKPPPPQRASGAQRATPPPTTRLPSLGPRGEGWVLVQGLLIAAIVAAGLLADDLRGHTSWLATLIGAVLLAAGAILAGLAVRDLGPAFTPLPRPRAGAPIVRTGAYRLARHPIYGGLILMACGWAIVTASPAAVVLALLLLGFFVLKSRREEAWLAAVDPTYEDYRARTRRFVPWVW